MAKTTATRKTTRRAQQPKQTKGKKTKQTAPSGRRKATKPAAPRIDASRYDHWRLPTGFVLFLADGRGIGHMHFVQDPTHVRTETDAGLRLMKAWPISEADMDIVVDALRPVCIGPQRYLREGPALAMERTLPQVLNRHWKRALAEEARSAKLAAKAAAKAEARDVASRLKAHNAFMANLAKHAKALAALAY